MTFTKAFDALPAWMHAQAHGASCVRKLCVNGCAGAGVVAINEALAVVFDGAISTEAAGNVVGQHLLSPSFRWYLFPGDGRMYAVCNTGRKNIGPLANSLGGDADSFGSGSQGAAEFLNGFCFKHVEIKACF